MIFAVDFDGTVVKDKFPFIGKDVPYAVNVLKQLVDKGHLIVLYTMRDDGCGFIPESQQYYSGTFLSEAVNWFKEAGIKLSGINQSPSQGFSKSSKIYADYYIDDRNIGTPIIKDNLGNKYVDWFKIEDLLKQNNIL